MPEAWEQKSIRTLSRHFRLCARPVVLLAILAFVFSAGCGSKSKPAPVSLDRRNPESVIRAYFDAWERGDWPGEATLMDEKFEGLVPEPAESIKLLEVSPLKTSSATHPVYRVIFEIKVKEGISMESGRYDWTYELIWDSQRASWLISNYGAG